LEELQISLTPARVDQRNFGLWLRTPQVGQVLNAVVADKLPSGEMVLKVGAERVTASTDIPLQPGARLLLEVKQVQPQITFRVLSAGGAPYVAAPDAMTEAIKLQRQAGTTQVPKDGLAQLFSLLRALGSGSLQALGLDRAIVKQLQGSVKPSDELTKPDLLIKALQGNGTFHESLLAHGTSNMAGLAADDLKGQLMRAVFRVRANLEDSDKLGLEADQVGLLEALRSALEGGLKTITDNQLGSVPAEQTQLPQQWCFDIPFRFGEEVYNIGIQIFEDSADSAAGEGAVSKTWAAHISLNMPGLGATEITVKLVGERISVDLAGSEQETLALFLRSQQSLTAGLESRGLKLDRLNVVHDQSLSRHGSNAPALDVRA
jgi:hypothetical protein